MLLSCVSQKSSQNPGTRPSERKFIEMIIPQITHIFNFYLKSHHYDARNIAKIMHLRRDRLKITPL